MNATVLQVRARVNPGERKNDMCDGGGEGVCAQSFAERQGNPRYCACAAMRLLTPEPPIGLADAMTSRAAIFVHAYQAARARFAAAGVALADRASIAAGRVGRTHVRITEQAA